MIALIINDREVLQEEVKKEWNLAKKVYQENGKDLTPEIEQAILHYAKQNIITRVLLEHCAQQSDEEIDFKEIQTEYRKMLNHFGGKKKFFEHFSNKETTEFQIKFNIEKSILVNRMIDRWKKEGAALLQEEEMIAYYESYKENFVSDEGVLVVHYSLLEEEMKKNEFLKAEKHLRLQYEHFLKTKQEKDLTNLIKSIPSIKIKDNVLVKKRFLEKELEQILFSLADSDYTELVRNHEGIHFFKKIKQVKSEILEYEEVREQIKKEVKKIKGDRFIKEKIDLLKQQAKIKDFFPFESAS